jgi:hypothetical protein
VITPDEFFRRMREIEKSADPEGGHLAADELMCEILDDLGYGDGVEIFERMGKWYA